MQTVRTSSTSFRSRFDAVLLLTASGILVAAFLASAISKQVFLRYFGAEDSITEDATAMLLAVAGIVLILRGVRNRASLTGFAIGLSILYGLVYIWTGGEEISWGQRIIGFDSPQYFAENNDQGEFTFHNLVIGDVKLDESLFGPLLSAIILSYLIVLPLLWQRFLWVQNIVRTLAIPVPRMHHAAYALAVTLIIPLLDQSRRWEVYECIFALLSLAIFLHPANPLLSEDS